MQTKLLPSITRRKKRKHVLRALVVLLLCSPFSSMAQPVGATINNPIVMGTYSGGSFTYSDTKSNNTANGYQNNMGQASDDIYYQFTVQGSTSITISHCGAAFDTYMHLLSSGGTVITFCDDNGPLCSGTAASIQTTLSAGTYYIVSEGYGSNSGSITTSVSLTVAGAPVTYNTRNFVRTWEATAPETDVNAVMSKTLRDVKQSTVYLDGLGRPEQTVAKQGSSITGATGAYDLVAPTGYDAYGREDFKYLPYVSSASDGLFRSSASTEQPAFNAGFYSAQGESNFYSRTDFEASPLNRVNKTLAPGVNWAGAANGGRGVEQKYWLNTTADAVRIWNVTDVSGGFGTYGPPLNGGTYPAGTLYKAATIDERGKQVIEFKDKDGQVILKKVQLTDAAYDDGTAGKDHTGWLCTYYIYDDFNQLRAVLQPKAVEELAKPAVNWQLSTDILNELTFRYEYDSRGRMVMKKVPGAGEVYMVYDRWDRLVLTQDANQRQSGTWTYTKYDELDRPVVTGLHSHAVTLAEINAHLKEAESWQIRYESPNTSATGYTLTQTYPYQVEGSVLTVTHYDKDYTGLPSGLASSFNASGYTTYLNGSAASPEYAETVPSSPSVATVGKVTYTKTKVLGTASQFLYSVNLYDDKGRVVQVQSKNVTDAVDVVTNQYSFSNQVLRTHIKHWKGTTQMYEWATRNTYDELGRVTMIEKNLSNGWKPISSTSYDALGQLKTRKLSPAYNNNAGLETLTYDYNIRGWLLGMNRDYLRDNTASEYQQRYFGYELGYDKSATTPGSTGFGYLQYNGNIAGTIWKSAGDQVRRYYDFLYDNANRLGRANYYQYVNPAGGDTWNLNDASFSVHGNDPAYYNAVSGNNNYIKYDANGNILGMVQHGWTLSSANTVIDALSYNYHNNSLSNRLMNVIEGAQDKNTRLGDFRYSSTYESIVSTNKASNTIDYTYDANGNLKKDLNKDIGTSSTDGITYNYLNLPSTITVAGKGSIDYIYDAAGNKLKKIVHENGVDKTTWYLIGTYEDEVMQFLPTEEGRIRPVRNSSGTITAFTYDYFVKDHLGNVRMVLTEEQKTDPYEQLTFEDLNATQQNAQWENKNGQSISVATSRTSRPGLFGTQSSNGDYSMLVRKSTGSIGATKFLKVMAGDRIHTKIDYYYNIAGANNSGADPVTNFVNSLTNSFLNRSTPSSVVKGQGATVATQLQNNSAFTSFINPSPNTNPSNAAQQAPKAYLCVLFFDEQFKFDQASSKVVKVAYAPGVKNTIDLTFSNAVAAGKNGYVYLYFTNESDELVYFDNFSLTHERSPILEETHYYPFGLTMAGISSKAAGSLVNRKKFNFGTELASSEFEDGSGLEIYETTFRGLDPQLGRWWQIDPHAEYHLGTSPYAYVLNNPLIYNDPLGLDTIKVFGAGRHKIKVRQGDILAWFDGNTISYYTYDPNNKDAVGGFVGTGIEQMMDNFIATNKNDGKKAKKTGAGYSFPWLTAFGTANSFGTFLSHNKAGWYSFSQNKFYSSKFYGNQYTAGGQKAAKALNTALTRTVGYGLGVWNMYDINRQYQNDNIGQLQMIGEQGMNLYSTLGGIYGAAAGIGWELGRGITSIPSYRANIRPLIQDGLGIPRDEYPKSPLLDKITKE